MVEKFHWSLLEIDETDIETLIPFFFEYPKWKETNSTGARRRRLYADEADWF